MKSQSGDKILFIFLFLFLILLFVYIYKTHRLCTTEYLIEREMRRIMGIPW